MFKRIAFAAAVIVATTTASMAAGPGWTTSGVNFRDGAGAYYAKIGSIPHCASIQLDYVSNGWYRVQWNGRWGWVAQRYVTSDGNYCANYSAPAHYNAPVHYNAPSYNKPASGGY